MENETTLVAPLSGVLVPLEDAPDAVFSGRVLGDGAAIEPLDGTLVAPCDGTVVLVHRAGHAVTLRTAAGAEVLMHVGVDTVKLGGRGFTPEVATGAAVTKGQRLVAFDVDAVARAAPSLQTMIIVTNGEAFEITWRASGPVERGKTPILVLRPRAATAAAPATAGTAAADAAEVAGTAKVAHAGGLHARPAALVREVARRYSATTTLKFGGRAASAASVVGVMGLGATQDAVVEIVARGGDAPAALAALVAAIETRVEAPRSAPPPPARKPALEDAAAGPAGALRGVRAVPGLAIGRAVRVDAFAADVVEHASDAAAERTRFDEARAKVSTDIARAVRQASSRGENEARSIFEAHAAMLDDPELTALAEASIARGKSAAFAVREAIRGQAAALRATENELLAERAADLEDLERSLLRAMGLGSATLPNLTEPSVVLADDLAPSDFGQLSREHLVGVATAKGGATSHVAILARAVGVPMLVAVGPELLLVEHATELLLDADAGWLATAPDAASVARARSAIERMQARRSAAGARAREPATTIDGEAIEVAANVATAADTAKAVASGADSVGLLRTELLFLERTTAPDEEEQRAEYQAVLDALEGRTAVIRTLDVGNDKELAYLPMAPEPNPALGVRGVRLGLARPEILDAQLRALLRVRPPSRLRVMLPMIADVGELARVRERMTRLAREIGVTELPSLGVMIEVPSAAILADQLASVADFFSIGTNDLTQYVLAMDRLNPALADQVDGLHPAVLRLVRQTVEGAKRHGRWVGVCGALASELDAVPILVGLGVTELSVGGAAVAEVKALVRRLDASACRRHVDELLLLRSGVEVRARARELWTEG